MSQYLRSPPTTAPTNPADATGVEDTCVQLQAPHPLHQAFTASFHSVSFLAYDDNMIAVILAIYYVYSCSHDKQANHQFTKTYNIYNAAPPHND